MIWNKTIGGMLRYQKQINGHRVIEKMYSSYLLTVTLTSLESPPAEGLSGAAAPKKVLAEEILGLFDLQGGRQIEEGLLFISLNKHISFTSAQSTTLQFLLTICDKELAACVLVA